MGFLGNMLSEAGKKAGRAIGNSLWGNKTDYVRLGDLNGDSVENAREAARIQAQADEERIENELLADQMRHVMELNFSSTNVDHNINVLAELDSIMESLPSLAWNRSDAEKKIYKAAKAKLMTGIDICLSKDPGNRIVRRIAEKYNF